MTREAKPRAKVSVIVPNVTEDLKININIFLCILNSVNILVNYIALQIRVMFP